MPTVNSHTCKIDRQTDTTQTRNYDEVHHVQYLVYLLLLSRFSLSYVKDHITEWLGEQ